MLGSSQKELIKKMFEANRQMQIMYKITFGILHNEADAEDVVQNAFMWIINNFEKASQMSDYERTLYLSVIVKNASLNILDKRKRHPVVNIDECEEIADADFSVEEQVIDNISVSEIEKALGELSETYYSLMYLYAFKHLVYREIAEELNIPEKIYTAISQGQEIALLKF